MRKFNGHLKTTIMHSSAFNSEAASVRHNLCCTCPATPHHHSAYTFSCPPHSAYTHPPHSPALLIRQWTNRCLECNVPRCLALRKLRQVAHQPHAKLASPTHSLLLAAAAAPAAGAAGCTSVVWKTRTAHRSPALPQTAWRLGGMGSPAAPLAASWTTAANQTAGARTPRGGNQTMAWQCLAALVRGCLREESWMLETGRMEVIVW